MTSRFLPVTLTAMEIALKVAGISPCKELAGLSQLRVTETRPGDVVLWYPEPHRRTGVPDGDFMHRLTAGAQLATAALSGKGSRSAGYVHAFMFTRDYSGVNEAHFSPEGLAKNAVFEIVGDMTGKRNTIGTTYRPAPFMMVFRHADEAIATQAAKIARVWRHRLDHVPFDMNSAAWSIVSDERFTTEARERAERYSLEPLSPDPDLLSQKTYCSSVLVALFQASALSLGRELTGALRVDASKVSPRDLHHQLEKDPAFKLVGYLADEPLPEDSPPKL